MIQPELDPASERLMAFIKDKGGPSVVAKAISKHPQVFYNIRDGKSKASLDTMREIALAFPDLDLNWVITGATSGSEFFHPALTGVNSEAKASYALTDGKAFGGLSAEYISQILAENRELKQELKDARSEIREAYQNYHEVVKPEFSGQTPVFSPFQVVDRPAIGFDYDTTIIKMHRQAPFVSITVGDVTRPFGEHTSTQESGTAGR